MEHQCYVPMIAKQFVATMNELSNHFLNRTGSALTEKGEQTMPDIRDVDGLWCDDITFCPIRCGWQSCPRNQRNIRDRTIPHSFTVEIPKDCPKVAEMVDRLNKKVKWE